MPYDVTTTRLDTQALFDLKGPAASLRRWTGPDLPAFPDQPNTRVDEGGLSLMWIGPDHWLLRAPLTEEAALEARLRPAEAPADISIVRVSDTLAFFRLTGPEVGEIMAIACPLDLHPARFGAQAACFTEAFGLKALVTRCADGFDLAVEQSYGALCADYLAQAIA